jgi:hypothetical protein
MALKIKGDSRATSSARRSRLDGKPCLITVGKGAMIEVVVVEAGEFGDEVAGDANVVKDLSADDGACGEERTVVDLVSTIVEAVMGVGGGGGSFVLSIMGVLH